MYNDFYNFRENPFSITADPDFYFSSQHHNDAFNHLMYGIEQRKGIIVITGEVGTGKTTLCRTLLSKLDSTTKTALIVNPSFSDVQLLRIIVKDFGIEGNFRNKYELIDVLNQFLLKETEQGHNIVLIIDEAQNLGIRQLEQIRLLSNLETEKEKLLQIILVGQPELKELLNDPRIRQLNQRVSVRCHICPLNRTELDSYINHRVQVALKEDDAAQRPSFTSEALDFIYKASIGTPRMVNILCDRALLAGFSSESKVIDEEILRQCSEEIQI